MTTNETMQNMQADIPIASEELSDLELEAVAGGAAKPAPGPGSSLAQVLLYQSTQGGHQAQAAQAVLSHVFKNPAFPGGVPAHSQGEVAFVSQQKEERGLGINL